ncbi:Transcription factor GRAS [Macleaya cordata]|uniref:Transcription factor GRAS n=1 Tax=Macleaya cordata TaxID=56857 RepID=A0A200QUK0_MACCD|nr:Transcription factor GRAS [Macleaya cordata]
MLAGCSTLLSPRHRLRSEASAQFQACHYQLPSMNTQRLDLPCSFNRKDASRSQPIRPVSLSVEKPFESKGSCSIRQKVRHPPSITTAQSAIWEGRRGIEDGFWEEEKKSLKRFAEQSSSDESCINRAKRKRSSSSELGSGNFWFSQNVEVPRITGIETPSVTLAKEERVSFLPLSTNPWVDYVVNETGDKDAETSQAITKVKSGSSNSSGSHNLTLKPESSEIETGNGSRIPYPSEGARLSARDVDELQPEHQDFELLSLLVACVESISSKNIPAITHFLSRLGELASPEGTSIRRVTAYFTEALALRVARLWPHIFHIAVPRDIDRAEEETGAALRLLNHVSPIPKFLHFTSNEMLLRAFEGKDRVHIIDFDIKQGLQWPSLFQSLASRTNPPSHVRITGIGESKQELQETGDRLALFASALNLPFEFHAVVDRLEDVRLWMLHVKEKETVAVNCILQLHKMLYDESGGVLRDFLGLIRSTNPIVVLMAEQEAEHNNPSLETRVSSSLKYYSAILDSIDSNLPLNSPVRIKIEEMFAREIRNIVSCEGIDRFERHESFGKWRSLMEQGGFRSVGIGEREMLQSQMLLKMYSSEKFSLEKRGEDGVGLTLSWLDQSLYTVSAWAPVDVAGSSSMSQPS